MSKVRYFKTNVDYFKWLHKNKYYVISVVLSDKIRVKYEV